MGYCTSFKLRVYEGDAEISEILKVHEDFGGLDYAFDEEGDPVDSVKWYDHDDDMRELSAYYPNVTFILEGEGEESGDIWRKYYRNGKAQEVYAEIVFADFDESKLR